MTAGSQGDSSQVNANKTKKKRGALSRKKSTASLKSLDPSEEEAIEQEYEKLIQGDDKMSLYPPDVLQKSVSPNFFL
jgi:hypothetical protein